MALTGQESSSKSSRNGFTPDEAIVISGMSALLPDCASITEFSNKLFNKENMVRHHTENSRWELSNPELGQYFGRIPGIDWFDPQFFMLNPYICKSTDLMSKIMFEQAYQALFDAGVSPKSVSGKKVGVFIATSLSETEKQIGYTKSKQLNGVLGSNKTMFANRISFCLNAKGPSYTVEAGCSSSLVALEKAYQAIQSGECEAAIVGATKGALHPHGAFHFQRMTAENPDGKTKCYDMNADGQTLSEAVVALYIQKYKDARRVYAQLCHVKNTFAAQLPKEYMDTYGAYRAPEKLSDFFREFYSEVGISPSSVEYIDGCGTALPETDKAELQALETVFCKDRTIPLYVGSVTSSIGYTEAASGLCGLVKVLLAYHKGQIPATLHCNNPRRDLNALADGLMQIATDHQPFNQSYAAVNCCSIFGIDSHVLLNGCSKEKNTSRYQSDLPYLITASGRVEEGVMKLLDHLGTNDIDPEEIGLLHQIFKEHIVRHQAKGYGIYTTSNDETKTLAKEVGFYDVGKRPLWFVYSGMGSQWAGMGKHLMRIPVFAAAIERCHRVLAPKDFDLINIITNPDNTLFNNVLNCFVGITAIQIGLTDVLKAIGLVPDNFIGHSVGELGCAYADGCCSAEEAILLSYYRGLVSIETKLIQGAMAAVGLGFKQISKLCPPQVEVACHNGPESSTISGPVEILKTFVEELQAQGIFAKEVQCSNIAYHSHYIAALGDQLLKYSREVIKSPKLRSGRWMSTSVSQDRWNDPETQYFSPEYHTNNLLSPVLFEETAALIPSNAVLIEIAPHGLLQPILRRSLPGDCKNIPLTRRVHRDNALFLLEALGKIYMEGFEMDLSALYPKVEFPVSTKTRNLSHLLSWDHTEIWPVTLYKSALRKYEAIYEPIITVYDEEYEYLLGSIIEGMRVLPFSAILVFAWDLLAMTNGIPIRQMSVQFTNVQFHAQPQLQEHSSLHITVSLLRGSGRFEATCGQLLVADGFIKEIEKDPRLVTYTVPEVDDEFELRTEDIYKLLFGRGYDYKGQFRSIHSINVPMTQAKLEWNDNWVTLIDGMFQLNALRRKHNAISEPHHVNNIIIDVNTHASCKNTNGLLFDAKVFENENVIRCGGILVEHIISKDKPLHLLDTVSLTTLQTVPFIQEEGFDLNTTLFVYMQIIAENLNKNCITLLRVKKSDNSSALDSISQLCNPPDLTVKTIIVRSEDAIDYVKSNKEVDAILVDEMTGDVNHFKTLCQALPFGSFVVNLGGNSQELFPSGIYNVVCKSRKAHLTIELGRWMKSVAKLTTAVTVETHDDIEMIRSTRNIYTDDQSLLVLTTYPPLSGLRSLIEKWRKEEKRNINMAMISSKGSSHLDSIPNFNLAFSIYNQGVWGGDYYVPYIEIEKRTMAALRCSNPGDLGSLHWVETPKIKKNRTITVHYAGLNMYDAKCALGKVSHTYEQGFGMDFSGVTERGERVMGLIPNGSTRGEIDIEGTQLLWPIPKHWSLEDAATVPFAYCYAFYCLVIKSQISRGTSVLVHGGAGALGQAIISIALAYDCQVFTTVSDIRKKKFLKMIFPNLRVNQIGNSRDIGFKDMVMSQTHGRGCRIVVNCLTGPLKNATISCCARFGIVLDVVQIHSNENYNLGMKSLGCIEYASVDFPSLFEDRNKDELELIRIMMSDGIACGYVRPLARVTYEAYEVTRAFQLLAASQHRGRVLLRLEGFVPSAKPRLTFSSDVSCLLLCDEVGFGLQIADFLVEHGVKKLHLQLPQWTSYINFKIQTWKNDGIEIHISNYDVYDSEKILQETSRLGPVDGIFVVSMKSFNPKQLESIISDLEKVSRKLCPNIRYFTVISNKCQERARSGMPALALHMNVKQFDYFGKSGTGDKLSLNWQDAMHVFETALHSRETMMRADIQTSLRDNIFNETTKISEIKMNHEEEETKLKNLERTNDSISDLCIILEEKYNIEEPKETSSELNVKQLTKLQGQVTDIAEEVNGLGAYINYINPDAILASSDMIMMRTLVHKTEMHPDEFENNQTFLFIIPGIEGQYKRFTKLCERVKLPTIVLQTGFDKFDETIEETAQRLVDVMIKRLKIKRFHLMGFEFGVLLALEMGAILERHGFIGHIYCLGGSHEDIQSAFQNKLNGWTKEKLQGEVVKHIYYLITDRESEELNRELDMLSNFDDKIEAGISKLREHVSHSHQYMREVMKTTYARIQLIRDYNKTPYSLRSKIILLRPLQGSSTDTIPPMSQRTVTTYKLCASTMHAAQDLRCAAIINKHIEPEILEEYNQKNHCDSFLLLDLDMVNTHNC